MVKQGTHRRGLTESRGCWHTRAITTFGRRKHFMSAWDISSSRKQIRRLSSRGSVPKWAIHDLIQRFSGMLHQKVRSPVEEAVNLIGTSQVVELEHGRIFSNYFAFLWPQVILICLGVIVATVCLLQSGTHIAANETLNVELRKRALLGDVAGVKVLLDKGADVNAKGRFGKTALIEAASGGNLEVVKLLIEKGADVNVKDSFDLTALMCAARGGKLEVVKLLVKKGAAVNAKSMSGWTALMIAASRCGNPEVVKPLIDMGVDVNAKDMSGWTALTLAAFKGNLALVKLLVEKGAHVNVKDCAGRTALNNASRWGRDGIARFLKVTGAKQ